MKKILITTAFFLLIAITQTSALRRISLDDFNRTLIRYGDWIEINYQVFVWQPTNVNRDWQPYSEGRWLWTEFGWFWDSEEPFGWITHHYGRWDYDNDYGWVWYPGYKWAPAWVEWRVSGDHIGWLPLSPDAKFDLQDGIYFTSSRSLDFTFWNFIKFNHLKFCSIQNHIVHRNRISSIYKQTDRRINYYLSNGVIICKAFLPKDIFGYNMVITHLEYTNDFRNIIENDIDILIRIPKKPHHPHPSPVPIEKPSRPIIVYNPTPPRNPIPDEVVNGRPKTREPVPEVVIVENRKPKIEKENKTEKRDKEIKEDQIKRIR